MGGKSKGPSGPTPEQIARQKEQEAKLKEQEAKIAEMERLAEEKQRMMAEKDSGSLMARRRRGRSLLSSENELGLQDKLG